MRQVYQAAAAFTTGIGFCCQNKTKQAPCAEGACSDAFLFFPELRRGPPAPRYSPRDLTSASMGALQSGSSVLRLRTLVTASHTTS